MSGLRHIINDKNKSILALLLSVLMISGLLPSVCAEEIPDAAEATAITEATGAAEPDASDPYAADSDKEAPQTETLDAEEWEKRLMQMLEKYGADPETVTAGFCNLVTGEEFYWQPDEYRVSGSMYKVPLNMLFLNWAEEGKLGPDETVYSLSYEQLLRGTIVHSDNNMAETLWDYAGAQLTTEPGTLYHKYRMQIAPLMGEDPYTVDEKFYENNFFTARQMIFCLKELYNGGLKYDRLISAMLDAEPNKYFRLYEKRFDVAHKYGWLAEGDILYLNDCGICFTDDPIAIVMFTTGTTEPYKVLSGYCTVCCDFANEQHAARLRQEEEAAAREQALLAAQAEGLENPENGDGSSIPEGSTQMEQGHVTEGPDAESADKTGLKLWESALLALFCPGATAAAILLGRGRRSGGAGVWTAVTVLIAVGAMILCLS